MSVHPHLRLNPHVNPVNLLRVADNPAIGFGSPVGNQGAQAAYPNQLALYLRQLVRVMAAVRGAPSCALGSLIPGLPTCVQPPPIRLVAIRGGSNNQGASP